MRISSSVEVCSRKKNTSGRPISSCRTFACPWCLTGALSHLDLSCTCRCVTISFRFVPRCVVSRLWDSRIIHIIPCGSLSHSTVVTVVGLLEFILDLCIPFLNHVSNSIADVSRPHSAESAHWHMAQTAQRCRLLYDAGFMLLLLVSVYKVPF